MTDSPKEELTYIHPYPKPGTIINGFKVVAPPATAKQREAMETDDFTTSGGCHTVHRQPVNK